MIGSLLIGSRVRLPSGQVAVVLAVVDGEVTCAYVERVRGEVVFSLRWVLAHCTVC